MNTIKEVLMERDGYTEQEALEEIREAKRALAEYLEQGNMEDAENICAEFFGLEPDYIFDLI